MTELFARHEQTLRSALEAIAKRGHWSAYGEMPSTKLYGENAKTDGEAAFRSRLGESFGLVGHPDDGASVGQEVSPFGLDLNITYPTAPIDRLIDASKAAQASWAQASIEARTGVCLEILHRLNKRSFELANAVMHTTGQAFIMAFQAGGPHAQDRGLEAVAYAFAEMTRTPSSATWRKSLGGDRSITMEKEYRLVPRGIGLLIGCATFPTWNGYPGLFANLATGNSAIVKPHPSAILPLAITVEIGREVISEAGFDPNLMLLAADHADKTITKQLATHPEVGIIDFTGSNAFGQWLSENVGSHVQVYTEEAGVNSIVVASTDDFRAMCDNVGFSLSLYSGQMCTTPQNIYVPRDGIETDEGHKTFDEVANAIAQSVDRLLSDPKRAAGVCGAIANPLTEQRIAECERLGAIVRRSGQIEGLEQARTATPLILKADAKNGDVFNKEYFGPISFIIAVNDADNAIDLASRLATENGAITAAIYATEDDVIDRAVSAFSTAGVSLSCNLFGGIYVNQSAAFSDFHVSGINPAGNATLTDVAFVANRFRIAMIRRLAA